MAVTTSENLDPGCYLIANNQKVNLIPFDYDVAQNMEGAGIAFDEDKYWNELSITLPEGGNLEFGLQKDVSQAKNWVIFRAFELYGLPALALPQHNLAGVENGVYKHDFENEGSLWVSLSHADTAVYYKFKPLPKLPSTTTFRACDLRTPPKAPSSSSARAPKPSRPS